MFHAIALLFLSLTGTLPVATPQELAVYTNCQPDRISHWIGQRIAYKKTEGWEPASVCMARGSGDCKCMAVVAEETLNACVGNDAQIAVLKNINATHAVALYTDFKGRRGFINEIDRQDFEPGTDWLKIVKAVRGGPWSIVRMYARGDVLQAPVLLASASPVPGK
ncbi:MAG TPA: hypothetical protein PKI19_09305 [Elusimicrobiales bacterium]|nr:hypothetical protein [Elusimicrobiales bacterium]